MSSTGSVNYITNIIDSVIGISMNRVKSYVRRRRPVMVPHL